MKNIIGLGEMESDMISGAVRGGVDAAEGLLICLLDESSEKCVYAAYPTVE